MLLFLPALVWAPFSFLLHNLIHEGAHAVAAKINGARILRIWPFPSMRTGYFTWAYMEHTPITKGMALLLAAPVIAELMWLSVFLTLSFTTHGAIQKVFLVEVVSSNVDIIVWLLGYWNPSPNSGCDAERFRDRMKFSRPAGKLLSLLHLPMMALCAFAIIRSF